MPRPDAPGCRSCGHDGLTRLLRLDDVPVANSLLFADRDAAASVARGDLVIDRCERCGFVQNSAFDPAIVVYDDDYEASQGHSATFVAYAERIADELIDRFDLHGCRALEIGCGGGDFLELFVARSGGSGVGYDPTLGDRAGVHGRVELRNEWYAPGSGHHDADLVMVRHTLEHIPDVADFLRMLRRELEGRPDAVLYVEVPDSRRIDTDGAFWDVYFEHCAYLDAEGLADLLRRTGFDPVEVRLEFEGQYLVAYARPAEAVAEVATPSDPLTFERVTANVDAWQRWSDDRVAAGERVAIWAASSKGGRPPVDGPWSRTRRGRRHQPGQRRGPSSRPRRRRSASPTSSRPTPRTAFC